jgi:VIT1/CCC1 family predicted Fe2+/Mn2+ transporter
VIVSPAAIRIELTVAATLVALGLTGFMGARLGGAPPGRGALRVVIWGVAAMTLTMVVGRLVGTNV